MRPKGASRRSIPLLRQQGVKQADVVWMSPDRRAEMKTTSDPPTLAPEICVKVLSLNNRWANIEEEIDLYLEAGAREVWVVDTERHIRIYGPKEMETSKIAPDCPRRL